MKQFSSEKAFTITELLVVIAIISLMSTLMLANYRAGERQFALQSSTHKLAQDLRRTQEMAMSMRQFSCPSGKLKGYGVRFEQNSESYSLMARCEDGGFQDYEKENIDLEEGVKIKELKKDGSLMSTLNIFFYPPDPDIDFGGTNKAKIILCLKADENNTTTISVNILGLINIE